MRAKLRLVERHQVEQAEITSHLGHDDRRRHLERVGDEVAVELGDQLGSVLSHRLGRLNRLAGMPQFGHQRPIGDALDVEHQIPDGGLAHKEQVTSSKFQVQGSSCGAFNFDLEL